MVGTAGDGGRRASCRPAGPAGSPRSPPCATPRPRTARCKRRTIVGAVVLLVGAALIGRAPLGLAAAACSSSASARCWRSSASRCCRRWSADRSRRSSGRLFPAAPRPARPRERDAQPAAHRGDRRGADDRPRPGQRRHASSGRRSRPASRRSPRTPSTRSSSSTPTPPGFPDAVLDDAKAQDGVSATAGVKVDGMHLCDNASCTAAKQVFVTAFPSSAIGDLVNITTVDGSDSSAPTRSSCPRMPRRRASCRSATRSACSSRDRTPEQLTARRDLKTNQLIGDYLVDESKARDFATQRNVAALVGIDDGADAPRSGRTLDSALKRVPEHRGAGPVGVRRPDAGPGQPDRDDHQHPARPVGDHRPARRHQHARPVGDRTDPRARSAPGGGHGPASR